MLFVPSACTSGNGSNGGGSGGAPGALHPALRPLAALFHLLLREGGPCVRRPRTIIWVHVGGTDSRGNSNDRPDNTGWSCSYENSSNSGNILFCFKRQYTPFRECEKNIS